MQAGALSFRSPAELPVLVLAPRGRDASLVADVLDREGMASEICDKPDTLTECFEGEVGAILLSEEALTRSSAQQIVGVLDEQPPWSEVPVLLLVDRGLEASALTRVMHALGDRHSITILERPLRPAALVAVLRFALRARQQQYAVRDLLDELSTLNRELQERVEARTAALQRRTEQARSLAHALSVAEQREREHISQLLHDDVQQLLYGLKLNLAVLREVDSVEERGALFDKVAGYADEAISHTRSLSAELHPPTLAGDDLGVAFGWLADHAQERYGLHVDLDVPDDIHVANENVTGLLTRAVRELLLNVVKHADSDRARIEATREPGRLCVCVEDEGRGFDPDEYEPGYGLFSVRERLMLLGGQIEVDSAPGRGTKIALIVPSEALDAQPSTGAA